RLRQPGHESRREPVAGDGRDVSGHERSSVLGHEFDEAVATDDEHGVGTGGIACRGRGIRGPRVIGGNLEERGLGCDASSTVVLPLSTNDWHGLPFSLLFVRPGWPAAIVYLRTCAWS